VMLVALGVKALATALRGWKLHLHKHEHGGRPHVHLHLHKPDELETHQHRHLIGLGTRPFLVGMVHGLAGSAALMILVVATIPSAVAGLIYIAVFGVGSVGGMLLMSSIVSLPFLLTAGRMSVVSRVLQVSVGVFSMGFGIYLLSQYGGLFGVR